ncbi:MAG: hypothetical protein KBA61_03290 [Spirochaetes bacterium]|nr:hypothetical protein [Spirochaetota bacterium]
MKPPAVIFTLMFLAVLETASFSGPNADPAVFGALRLPGYYCLLGPHVEYGSVTRGEPGDADRHASAAGLSLQFTYDDPRNFGASLLGDASYEFGGDSCRGRYGLELHVKNRLLVRYPETRFSMALRGGGIIRSGDGTGKGVFYGIGIFFPDLAWTQKHPFVYALYVERNHYLDNGKTRRIELTGQIKVQYRLKL